MNHREATSEVIGVDAIRARTAYFGERHLWRSLEEASGTPEFEEYLQREFPSQLAVWEDPVGRRAFLKLMAASLAFAGISGCTRSPEEKIVPYVRAPEDLVPGKPLFYATAMPRNGFGYGVLVESHMGRPTKIEGNPEHPVTRGGTDVFMQASILGLYDPDRSQTVLRNGIIDTWDRFVRFTTTEMEPLRKSKGRGLRILTETVTSPTTVAQIKALLELLPEARWHVFDPIGRDNPTAGALLAFGQVVDTAYHVDRADIILSLDCDFLAGLPGSLGYARDFADRRRVVTGNGSMNRLYVAESTPTITGASADHRIPWRPSSIEKLARELLSRTETDNEQSLHNSSLDIADRWLNVVIDDLKRHRGASLVIVGDGQPPIVHALGHSLNQALGNVGKTITYIEPVAVRPQSNGSTIRELVADMAGSKVKTLVILGGNPVYNTPGELQFAEHLVKVVRRVHLSDFYDETSALCHWHIPAAHYLEAWSDIRAADGTVSIIQPLISPLYEGKTAHEMLSVLSGKPNRSPYEIVQTHWQQTLGGKDFGDRWRLMLHNGFVSGTNSAEFEVTLNRSALQDVATTVSAGEEQTIDVEFRPDPTVWDGQYANNGWLQELPKPLSKITWDNVAAVSPPTAQRLGVSNGDVLEISVQGRSLRSPAWITPGQPDHCISLTLGYGRTRSGQVGTGIGYNAYALLPPGAAWFAAGTVGKTNDTYAIATTQQHHSMDGREIVRVMTVDEVKHPPEHNAHTLHAASEQLSLYPGFKYEGNSWGMVIDQTACIGCNACVVACQAENNIPVVGKEQVAVGREMHWIRIDRYYEGEPENPDTYFQPMMCVHCEQAPCEVVCPVAATVHDSEGTSNMIYNRCVGTRYCSNNCPYKVRRFNYLQFSDETTPSLKLQRNPDVSVRSRGVMEKCSYCIQRISAARIEAKLGDLPLVPEGRVQTACQQACPTRAITFGNLNASQSEVRKLKSSPLNYAVLAELNTQPRTTYLARVSNPHPGSRAAETDGARESAAHPATTPP